MLNITINILKDAGNWVKINEGCGDSRSILIGHIAEYHYVAFDEISANYSQTISETINQQNSLMDKKITCQNVLKTSALNISKCIKSAETPKNKPMTAAEQKTKI